MRHDLGSALIEFAIICPVLMLILIGGIDLGIAILDRVIL